MKIMLLFATAFALMGCGEMPSDPSEAQEQQMQRSFYGTGSPGLTNQAQAPASQDQPQREPVPGEEVPNR
jgi:hypothetical protein